MTTVDYSRRAGLNPEPVGWVHDMSTAHASVEHADEATAAGGYSFWADVSEFQCVVTGAYPYRQLCIRLDTGYRLDNHAGPNHTAWLKLKRDVLMGYAVFIPGESKAILGRLRNAFGAQLEGIAPMVDMESGSGFAGPGNHSSEANNFVNELAAATGSIAREVGYANSGDWSRNWPQRGNLRHRIIASYGSQLVPGYFAQQYYGALKYPVPAGFPKACAPFGSWVDLNAAHTTTAGLVTVLGFSAPTNQEFTMDAEAKAAFAALNARISTVEQLISKDRVETQANLTAAINDLPAKVAAALAKK